jgi:hypothetical protein
LERKQMPDHVKEVRKDEKKAPEQKGEEER